MSQLLARRLQRAGKLSLNMDEKNRGDVKSPPTLPDRGRFGLINRREKCSFLVLLRQYLVGLHYVDAVQPLPVELLEPQVDGLYATLFSLLSHPPVIVSTPEHVEALVSVRIGRFVRGLVSLVGPC
ncbi:hypothetical protein [Sphingomonas rubra]|uniref:hypothetical protein n=1 Tax=Sphingomonas rubra TaxID=634430 RepID=UPI001160BAE0|nr:hypothetical protein [Sphingomonas rubra]